MEEAKQGHMQTLDPTAVARRGCGGGGEHGSALESGYRLRSFVAVLKATDKYLERVVKTTSVTASTR